MNVPPDREPLEAYSAFSSDVLRLVALTMRDIRLILLQLLISTPSMLAVLWLLRN